MLATNVAESSLTLPGVRAVVDTGLAREPRFDPNSGFTRLETVTISQASADQRAGRAGRLGAGHLRIACGRRASGSKPIARRKSHKSNCPQLALELAAWGSTALRWLDAPPPARSRKRAICSMRSARSIAKDASPPLGRRMLDAAMHPRLAAMVHARGLREVALACDLVALVEARNPLRGNAAGIDDFRRRVTRARGVARARSRGRTRLRRRHRRAGGDRASRATRRRRPHSDVRERAANAIAARIDSAAATRAICCCTRIRIASRARTRANPRRYQLANGRGARLRDDSALYGEPWLVVVDLRYDERDSLIQSAAPFDADLLERDFAASLRRDERVVRWNRDTRAVDAFEERRFDAIVLERRSVPPRREDAVPAMLAAVRELGLDALPWSDHARELRLRVQSLREWDPALGLPDFSDDALLAALDEWLAPYLDGKRRLDALVRGGAFRSAVVASRLCDAHRARRARAGDDPRAERNGAPHRLRAGRSRRCSRSSCRNCSVSPTRRASPAAACR